jgi:uncharacterized membrane protein
MGWRVVAGLILLSLIPVVAGAFRVTQLTGGVEVTPENARFVASPIPVVLHIVSATVYAILGAFQFADGFRRRWPGWHRAAGRVLVLSGLVVGLSGLWMTLFYPRSESIGALLLFGLRLLFGSAIVGSTVLGLTTIRRGDVARHRAWMTRGYAIGMGAGTQVITETIGAIVVGHSGELGKALLMGAAWAINLAVAERAIRRGTRPKARRGVSSAACGDSVAAGVASPA